MPTRPLISVIMPAYNCERFIGEAIDSVLAQTYDRIELIVIDDCSRDNTAAVVEAYVARDPRVRLLRNRVNQNVSPTRNRGIDHANGTYVAFLDSDDVWSREKLEKQLAMMEAENADVVYTSYGFIDEDGRPIKRPFVVPASTDFERMLCKNVIGNSTVLIRAELLKNCRFRSDVHHEDYALWMELLSIPVKAVGCVDVLMSYRQVSGARNDNKWRAARERWKIYRQVLHLGFWKSLRVMCSYAVSGLIKYYGPFRNSL